MTRLWWVRHGPTHARSMIGWTDLPADLTELARINRLSAYLPAAPVIASDLRRARDTARALGDDRPALPPDPDLREIHFGDWEGKRHDEIDPMLSRAYWESPGDHAPPGGESWNAAAARVSRATDRLLARGERDLIVVAHMGAILTQLARATGQSPAEVLGQRIEPLSVTVLDWQAGAWSVGPINHQP